MHYSQRLCLVESGNVGEIQRRKWTVRRGGKEASGPLSDHRPLGPDRLAEQCLVVAFCCVECETFSSTSCLRAFLVYLHLLLPAS